MENTKIEMEQENNTEMPPKYTSNKKKPFLSWFNVSGCVNAKVALLGVLPIVIALLLFSVLPAVVNIIMSFTDYTGDISKVKFVGFQNYYRFWTMIGADVLPAFWTTIKYSLMTVVPLQIVAFGAALLVNMKFKTSNAFRAIYFMPSILGSAVVALSWKLMYDPNIGPFAKFLELFGMSSAFLGDEKIALICIVIMAIWASFGYAMTIYIAGLQGVPRDLYEAASIDGAGSFMQFWKITLPLMRASVTINLWIAISGTLGMADYIMLTTKGAYGTNTIGYYIFDSVMRQTVSQGQSAATAIYFFIFITTVMLAFNAIFRRKEVTM